MADAAGQHLLSPPPIHHDSWYPYSNGGSHIAMILIFIFCALVCALAINTAIRFFVRSYPEQPPASQEDGKATNSTDPSTLALFPTLLFSSETKTKLAGGEVAAECAICLSEFVEGEGVRILPKCKHGFHVKCIEGWLLSHLSCPTCRTACRDNDEHYDVEAPPPPSSPPPPAAAENLGRPAGVSAD